MVKSLFKFISVGDATATEEAMVSDVAMAVAAFVKSLSDLETENASHAEAIIEAIIIELNFMLCLVCGSEKRIRDDDNSSF
jgi:hypothetical protein